MLLFTQSYYIFVWIPFCLVSIACNSIIFFILYSKRKEAILGNGFFTLCRYLCIVEILQTVNFQIFWGFPLHDILTNEFYLPLRIVISQAGCFLLMLVSYPRNFLFALMAVNRIYILSGWDRIGNVIFMSIYNIRLQTLFNKIIKYTFIILCYMNVIMWAIITFTWTSDYKINVDLTNNDTFFQLACHTGSDARITFKNEIQFGFRVFNVCLASVAYIVCIKQMLKLRKLTSAADRADRFMEVKTCTAMTLDTLINIGTAIFFQYYINQMFAGVLIRAFIQQEDAKRLATPILLCMFSSDLRESIKDRFFPRFLRASSRVIIIQSSVIPPNS